MNSIYVRERPPRDHERIASPGIIDATLLDRTKISSIFERKPRSEGERIWAYCRGSRNKALVRDKIIAVVWVVHRRNGLPTFRKRVYGQLQESEVRNCERFESGWDRVCQENGFNS